MVMTEQSDDNLVACWSCRGPVSAAALFCHTCGAVQPPGGQNHCVLHLDGVFLNATLQIVDDGTYILKDGEWAL